MEEFVPGVKIKVIGVWQGWCNFVDKMISEWLEGVDFVAIGTDTQNLAIKLADKKINIGLNLSINFIGFWTWANIEIGRKAAEEHEHEIKEMLKDTDMVFITCGTGWWTGGGAAPVIATIAKGMGILTVGIITTPFSFEWEKRVMNSEEGVKKIKEAVDTLIVSSDDKIFNIIDKETTFKQAFTMIDKIPYLLVQWISDLLVKPWDITIEFNDIKWMMKDSGDWWIWIGYGLWKDRVMKATKWAIENFLLYGDLHKAKHIILSVTGWNDLNPAEIKEGFSTLEDIIGEQIPCMWCSVFDKSYKDKVKVTIIWTWIGE